jgi:hypothetical protein
VSDYSAFMAATEPAGMPSGGGDPYAAFMVATAQPEQYSVPETIGRNAVNLFGAGPAVSGAFQAIANGRKYEEARDETKRHLEEANAQHPIAGYVGKGIALGGETLLGGALGKAVSVGAKLAGAAEALSPVMARLGSTGGAIAKGALGGAAYGAAGAAGSALSAGQDVLPAAAEGAATGGALGGALGGVAHKIGEAFEGAIGGQNESIVRGASERALPRKQSALADLIEKELPAGAKSKVSASEVIQENRDLLKGFRSADPEVVQAAREATLEKADSYEIGKAAKYEQVDKALGGGAPARAAIDDLENKASVETEAPWKKVLTDKVSSLKQQWSSISTDEAKRYLQAMRVTGDQAARDALEGLAAKLPEGRQWTKMQFLDHLVGGERGASTRAWAEIPPDLRKAVEQLPFKFDGDIKIPTRDLRRLLTMSQDEAESALGTLNATKNARLAALNQEVLGHTLNKQLDTAARAGGEGVSGAVQAIRDNNVRQSVLLKLADASSRKVEKLRLGKPTLGGIAAGGASGLLGGYEALGAAKHLIHGDFASAGVDALGAIAAKSAPRLAVAAKFGATDALARLQREVTAGNPRAVALLKSLQASGRLGTAGAGAVGAATSGTLGASPP